MSILCKWKVISIIFVLVVKGVLDVFLLLIIHVGGFNSKPCFYMLILPMTQNWVFSFFSLSLSLFSNGQSGTLGKRPEKFNVQNSSLITVSVAGLNKHPQSKSFILVLIISGQEVKDVLNCFEWNYEACELMCVMYRERRPGVVTKDCFSDSFESKV